MKLCHLLKILSVAWVLSLALVHSAAVYAQAAENPFAGGWSLQSEASSLTVQSIKEKDGPKQETSSFASFNGQVDDSGLATLRVQLDSIDTKIDLRNVRMRFLFFETFKFPEAVITAKVDKILMDTLLQQRRMTVPIEFELDLHGIKNSFEVNSIITLFADDQLSIASVSPVSIAVGLFDLEEGLQKLQDAAKVQIVPSGAVSFDLVFKRNIPGSGNIPATIASAPAAAPAAQPVVAASTALETSGNFSKEECTGRFQILSETGAIYFRTGSSSLSPESYALLATVTDIINRCPDLEIVIAGHTDSAGGSRTNLNLSIARANSVMQYLIGQGVGGERITAIGYGETKPVAPNDTARNRSRNRRIEFASVSG